MRWRTCLDWTVVTISGPPNESRRMFCSGSAILTDGLISSACWLLRTRRRGTDARIS